MLKNLSTLPPAELSKASTKEKLKELSVSIAELQRILYAQQKFSLLVILQGMDASGKDGIINKVFGALNPLGCKVYSFKKPTDREFAHDFLWRVHARVPPRGMVHIFNRSHYEDILVPSVEGTIPEDKIEERFLQINHFEQLLQSHGTQILKVYLHVSREEQEKRLLERLNLREKFWKHNDGDWSSRRKWDAYQKTYQTIFERCNTIPWHIVPADKNWFKNLRVLELVHQELSRLPLAWPDLETDFFKNKTGAK